MLLLTLVTVAAADVRSDVNPLRGTVPSGVSLADGAATPRAFADEEPFTVGMTLNPAWRLRAIPAAYVAGPSATAASRYSTFTIRATAYTSHQAQTDATPFVTATGARTRFGIVALSRDMLRRIPYGSRIQLQDLGSWGTGRGRGAHDRLLSTTTFIVEDTMHPRKVGQIDVWMPAYRQAIQWGVRQVRVTVLQYGRFRA